MAGLKGGGDFFALDVGSTSVRVVQLSRGGDGSFSLQNFGYASTDIKTTSSSTPEDQRRLGEVIMTAIGQSGIRTKNVVIGLPSSKTFTTVIEVPLMSDAELKSTLKYQIDQYIPMSSADAKFDYVSLGPSPRDPKQLEVLISSTANQYAEDRLEFIESLGLNVIAAEPEPLAMVRSLLPAGIQDARLIIDMGELSTDIAVTFGDAPRLVRTIPTGLQTLVRTAVQNLNVGEAQARQFILKFGLAPDKLDGQVFRALEPALDTFSGELIKSVKFFQTRYPNSQLGGIMLSGFTSVLPMFGEYLASKTQVAAVIANPWQKVKVGAAEQQQLASMASEFAVALGLAERMNLL